MLAAGRINGAVETWALDTGKVVTRDLLGKELAGLAFPKADRLVALTQDGKQLRARDLFARQEVFSVPLATDQRVWAAV